MASTGGSCITAHLY